jgi:hypothetical protein
MEIELNGSVKRGVPGLRSGLRFFINLLLTHATRVVELTH